MIKLSLTQFECRLHSVSRCQPVGFTSIVTPSRMRKTNNPLAGMARKVSIGRGLINCIYEDGVNRQRLREGLPADFIAGPPAVGNRVEDTPLCCKVCDNGESRFYLELFVQKVHSHYFCTEDNRELSYFDDIKPFEYQKPAVDPLRKKQGTKKLIRPTVYGLKSIAELRLGGEAWAVRPLVDELHSYLPAQASSSHPSDDVAHQQQSEAVA